VKFLVLVLSLGFFAASVAHACDEDKKGYWWYCEPETDIQEHVPERQPLPAPPSHQTMMKMHPDDIQKMQEDYLKQAVWQTTPEHVLNYYKVLDVARRKSLAFTSVTELVMLENPNLNAWGQYQKTATARKAVTQHKAANIQTSLVAQRAEYGLIFFTRPDCPFCRGQANVLAYFSDKYGWPVQAVDISQQPDLATRFNIDYVPLTILAKKGSEAWMPVAVGEEPLTTLEANVYRAIRYLSGKTSADQFLQMEFQDGTALDPLEARL